MVSFTPVAINNFPHVSLLRDNICVRQHKQTQKYFNQYNHHLVYIFNIYARMSHGQARHFRRWKTWREEAAKYNVGIRNAWYIEMDFRVSIHSLERQ